MVLVQPNVTVDACAFIEPSFILGSVCPHHEYIVLIEANIVCDILGNTGVPAFMIAQEETVDPDVGIAKDAIELHLEPLPGIDAGDVKMPTVPADTGFREQSSHRLITVGHHIKIVHVHKW